MGIVDDDETLKGQYVGSLRVFGTFEDIPKIINEYNIDAVVIACDIGEERIQEIKESLQDLSVALYKFNLSEETIIPAAGGRKEKNI